jgi:hypothetical protein
MIKTNEIEAGMANLIFSLNVFCLYGIRAISNPIGRANKKMVIRLLIKSTKKITIFSPLEKSTLV